MPFIKLQVYGTIGPTGRLEDAEARFSDHPKGFAPRHKWGTVQTVWYKDTLKDWGGEGEASPEEGVLAVLNSLEEANMIKPADRLSESGVARTWKSEEREGATNFIQEFLLHTVR